MTIARILMIAGIAASFNAYAHDEGEGGVGFITGLLHPALGFDHFLAMLSVGILSAQIGGRGLWVVPLTFVSVMVVGGALGITGVSLPLVESGIALSVVALGVALAADKHMATIWAMLFVGFFAIFHGHAHGTEMPLIADPILYALGFVTGTALIHLTGVLIGLGSGRLDNGTMVLRLLGAGIAGMGVCMLFGG
jgi:urease accessory protein